MKANSDGFTLPETIIASLISMIVIMMTCRLLNHVSHIAAKTMVRRELAESAMTAMDAMTANIKITHKIDIKFNHGVLDRMDLDDYKDSRGVTRGCVFSYEKTAGISDPGYHRLIFDNVELASNLADIKIVKNGNFLYITVITDDHITANRSSDYAEPYIKSYRAAVEPVILTATVNIYGKIYSLLPRST